MDPKPQTDNDKITIAILRSEKKMVKEIQGLRTDLAPTLSALADRTRAVELVCATEKQRLDTIKEDVDSLKKRSNFWDGLNSLGVVGAFLAGLFTK